MLKAFMQQIRLPPKLYISIWNLQNIKREFSLYGFRLYDRTGWVGRH